MDAIEDLIKTFNHVSMDTEFPGTVFLPPEVSHDFEYQVVRSNVNNLKLIQIGITLADESGRLPEGTCCWQFNLSFDL